MGNVVVAEQTAHVLWTHAQLCGYLRGGLRAVVQDASNPVNDWRPAGLGSVPRSSSDVTDVAGEAATVGPRAERYFLVQARALNAATVRRIEHLVPTLAAARVFKIALAGGSGRCGQLSTGSHTAPHMTADQKR